MQTERLLLRPWREADRAPFAAMGQDARVMRFFPALITREESDAMIDRSIAATAQQGFSFSPIELKQTGEFIGLGGLSVPRVQLPFSPCVEIGWRLAAAHWGKGYATEAARAWLQFGFEQMQLAEIVSFTALENLPSQRVMERLAMTRNAAENFYHPAIPEGVPLRRHCLYRLTRAQWQAARGAQ